MLARCTRGHALRAYPMFAGSFLTALLVLVGCGPDFDRPSVVDSLRILAVRADPAAVRPGEATTLSALIADPLGDGRVLAHAWGACVVIDPDGGGVEFQLPSDCAASEGELPPPGVLSADGSQVTVAIPPLCDDPPVPPCLPPDLSDVEGLTGQSGAFGLPVRLVIAAGEERQIAMASVSVVLDAEQPPNLNPEFDGLFEAGSPWPQGEPRTVREEPALSLAASWPADAAEEYSYVPSGSDEAVHVQEVVAVNWYASLGRFSPDVTSAGFVDTELALDADKPAPQAAEPRLWAVISDGRGGVAWTDRPLSRP